MRIETQCIAVSTERGLMVPVLRNAEHMSLPDIERGIREYAGKARDGNIALEDLQGGTFTITNGGTFGSLLSTPLLNPPQSAILGMHNIKQASGRAGSTSSTQTSHEGSKAPERQAIT